MSNRSRTSDKHGKSNGSVAETPVNHSKRTVSGRHRVFQVAAAVLGLASTVGFFLANPAEVELPKYSNPHELLRDVSFNQTGIWLPVGDAKSNTFSRQRQGGPQPFFGKVKGTIRQEIPLRPENKRAYRFSLMARADSGAPSVTGTLRAQTACASDEERAETAIVANKSWQAFSVTVVPQHGDACSLRVEIVGPKSGTGALDVTSASFVDAGLANPSFDGAGSWQITKANEGGQFRSIPMAGAPDGGAVGELVVGTSPTSIGQDIALDLSSEGVIGAFSMMARTTKNSADAELRLREPCSDRTATTKVKLTNVWQLVSVRQARLPTPKGELPVDVPSLIRPGGPACTMRVELRVLTANATVQFDAAYFDLQSYNPPAGSPRYRAAVKSQLPDGVDQSGAGAPTQNGPGPSGQNPPATAP